jgi:hypothetical protein
MTNTIRVLHISAQNLLSPNKEELKAWASKK